MMQNNSLNIQKPKVAYLCSFFPRKVFEKHGFETISVAESSYKIDTRNPCIPTNICEYIHYCQAVIDKMDIDGVVITNCCNGMQRLYDFIKIKRPDIFCMLLDLPRDNSHLEYEYFINNVKNLCMSMCNRFSIHYTESIYDVCIDEQQDTLMVKDTVYIFGNSISSQLQQALSQFVEPYNTRFNVCTSRDMGDMLVNGEHIIPDYEPCARTGYFLAWFKNFVLKNKTNLAGVIFISSQHCDSYLFTYPSIKEICRKECIPITSIDITYLNNGLGQISTRLEAFIEHLKYGGRMEVNDEIDVLGKNDYSKEFTKRMHLVNGIKSTLPLTAIQKVVDNQIDIFTNKVWSCKDKVIWTNMVMPVEVFYAAGLIPVNMELVAGWLASLGLSRHYVSLSESMGFNTSLCSYHKAAIGVIEEGGLPHPRGAAISTHICDGGVGVVNHLEANYNTKTFILNIPFHNNQSSLQYVAQQYEELIGWIEKVYSVQITKNKLRHALMLSNQAREYWIKAFELRKGRPVFPGHLSLRNLFGTTFLFGSQLGVDVAKSYYEQLVELRKNSNDTSFERKKRILWIHFAPLYANNIMQYLENDLDCCIVMDITGHIYWPEYDLDNPLEGLANRSLSHFYLQEAELRKDLYIQLIDEYKIEGIIHFMHNGCRAIPGSSWLVRDIATEHKLPYLELNGDCIDPRGFSENQMRLRMEAFRESLGGDKFVFGN